MKFTALIIASLLASLLASLSASLLFSCSIQDRPDIPPSNTEAPTETKTPPATMEYAIGWEELILNGRTTKITLDSVGHFQITRNACYKEESGSLALEDWNNLNRTLNAALKTLPLQELACSPTPEAPYVLDGNAEVKVSSEAKRLLFEARGNTICTSVSSPTQASELLAAIHKVLRAAMLEACPSGSPYD